MANGKYNLIDEKWIYALSKNGKAEKVSLKDVFLHAGDYIDLGGETRLQDISILRMLIAISVTLLYRYDENGNSSYLDDYEQAIERYAKVWGKGKFPESAVTEYFDKWYDRFFLFDSKYPFYQISLEDPDIEVVKWDEAEKNDQKNVKNFFNGRLLKFANGAYMNWMPISFINGRILQSNNKSSAFKDVTGEKEERVSYDEAARWIVYYNAFADCTVGKNQKIETRGTQAKKETTNAGMTMPSRGMLLTPVGDNLFQTIMLGSVLFDDRNELYPTCIPAWEKEDRKSDKRIIPVPNDLAQMYTQQARRMYVVGENGYVPGIYVSAGEVYRDDLLFKNPAFVMVKNKKKDAKTEKTPAHCSDASDIWKTIAYIAGDENSGIKKWIKVVEERELLEEDRLIPFRITDIKYGASSCSVEKTIEDTVVMNRAFIKENERQIAAATEVESVKKIADIIYVHGKEYGQCMGFDKKYNALGSDLKRQYSDAAGKKILQFAAGQIGLEELRGEKIAIARKIMDDFISDNAEALLHGKRKSGDRGSGISLGKVSLDFERKLRTIAKHQSN